MSEPNGDPAGGDERTGPVSGLTGPVISPTGPVGTLTGINVYPIKSAKGTSLSRGVVTPTGLAHDREWMVVDDTGSFVSQRELPRLCLIQPTLGAADLIISAPGMSDISVPLDGEGAGQRRVRVWADEVEAETTSAEADEWLSDFLGARHHLVRIPPRTVRGVDPTYGQPGDRVGFADAFPFLVISQASLDDLNQRLADKGHETLPMNRFRPNLVVAGTEPFAEDTWGRVRIGAIGFRVVKPCARCVITTTDQATGVVGREPLRTLATYRRVGGKVMFGQNACHDQTGELVIGDEVARA